MNEKINTSFYIIFFGFFFVIWRLLAYIYNWEHYYIFLDKIETHNYLMDINPKATIIHIISINILIINVIQYYRKKRSIT